MNLHEIIHLLAGMNWDEREQEMDNLGVDEALRVHIHACYDVQHKLMSSAEWTPNLLDEGDADPAPDPREGQPGPKARIVCHKCKTKSKWYTTKYTGSGYLVVTNRPHPYICKKCGEAIGHATWETQGEEFDP